MATASNVVNLLEGVIYFNMAAACNSTMAGFSRTNDWKFDDELQAYLREIVLKNFNRKETLDFVKKEFPMYVWSLSTLDRRRRFFGIKYIDYTVDVDTVKEAFSQENKGTGMLLGYRAMHKKLREKYGLAVPRNLVYDVMTQEDTEGLERRKVVGGTKRKRGNVGTFTSMGSNHTYSGDGHDKLMGFQNDTFPLAVYGFQDVFSNKILLLKLWTSNSDPQLIGRWYLNMVSESGVTSQRLRLDKGSETGTIATMHGYLHAQKNPDVNIDQTVFYGPSTSNKIERWWRELHERLEMYFKSQLLMLLNNGLYDTTNTLDRQLLAFVYIPVIQSEMDDFRSLWNSHRVRKQRKSMVPKGIPDHLYEFPELYGAEQCGLEVLENDVTEIESLSGVGTYSDFLPEDVQRKCEAIIEDVHNIPATEAANVYMLLKSSYIPDSQNSI